ncbi:uncharacterized protein LOC128556973 [Mercenaria mercenaria]|uniref:uncharacterized protein LOC128556973 n=1 Tax=Mercenaria mercenaria TaxID=6596 RepID=UPI00234FB0C0|nr:uncharacterized protein LOC128556973 [Mercenaria mercenaria]
MDIYNLPRDRVKDTLKSPPARHVSVSDSYTVSMLSVRDPVADDESDVSVTESGDDTEYLAEASFAGDADEHIKDPCAICFTNRNYSKKATHFCSDCGLLGHFLCEQCLGFHKKFTNHKAVKSFVAAKYKRGGNMTDTQKELDNERESVKVAKREVSERNTKIKELAVDLQTANVQLKVLRFKLQLTEDMK